MEPQLHSTGVNTPSFAELPKTPIRQETANEPYHGHNVSSNPNKDSPTIVYCAKRSLNVSDSNPNGISKLSRTFSRLGPSLTKLAARIKGAIKNIFTLSRRTTAQSPENKMDEHSKRIGNELSQKFIAGYEQKESPRSYIQNIFAQLQNEGCSREEAVKILEEGVNRALEGPANDYIERGIITEKPNFSWVKEVKSELQNLLPEQQILNPDLSREEIGQAIQRIKDNALASMPKTATPEEKNRAVSKELTSVLSKLVPLEDHIEANRLVSKELGMAILQPQSFTKETDNSSGSEKIMRYIENKGIKSPKKCGEDLWRAMKGLELATYSEQEPIVSGRSSIEADPDRNREMYKVLNTFYQHVTGREDLLISDAESHGTMGEAGDFAEKMERILKEKNIPPEQITVMQRLLGLGAQELFTRPGSEAMPTEYRLKGQDNLQLAEFSGGYVEHMRPMRYGREISINILENGKYEYTVKQPCTFKDQQTLNPLGFCVIETKFVFDNEMNFESQSQSILEAEQDVKKG